MGSGHETKINEAQLQVLVHSHHVLVGPTDVCKECSELALLSEEGRGEGGVQRVQLLWVRTSRVAELVVDGRHLLKAWVVALCQVL